VTTIPAVRARLHALADTASALDALLAEVSLDLPPAEAELLVTRLDQLARELDQVADKLGAALDPDTFCRDEMASGRPRPPRVRPAGNYRLATGHYRNSLYFFAILCKPCKASRFVVNSSLARFPLAFGLTRVAPVDLNVAGSCPVAHRSLTQSPQSPYLPCLLVRRE
jgi:hypothetical protein